MDIALEYGAENQTVIPATDSLDPGGDGKRSNQRTELLAAIEGLRRDTMSHDAPPPEQYHDKNGGLDSFWIIATDSEYVYKGITEWVYIWEVRLSSHLCLLAPVHPEYALIPLTGYWLARVLGVQPAGPDLFLHLHRAILGYESLKDILVGFWKIIGGSMDLLIL